MHRRGGAGGPLRLAAGIAVAAGLGVILPAAGAAAVPVGATPQSTGHPPERARFTGTVGAGLNACVDGEWTQQAYSLHDTYNTQPLVLTGGAGAQLYIAGSGTSRYVAEPPVTFTGSQDGVRASVTQRGTATFDAFVFGTIASTKGLIELKHWTYANFTQAGTYGGHAVGAPVSNTTIGETYTCSASTLKLAGTTGTILYTRAVSPAVGIAATSTGGGYWVAHSTGLVTAHGNAPLLGSMAGSTLAAPISHIVATPDGKGYWLVASDGGTFAFGDAQFFGSMGGRPLNVPVVDIAPTVDGKGYWLVASDGGIFAFGDAAFHGSMGGRHLNEPVVGMEPDFASGGYWEVASDGGIFAFGAPFFGSTGAIHLNRPVVGMAVTVSGLGYWFVATDGGLFAYGDAAFHGSMGGKPLNQPIVGMAADTSSGGYWEVAATGGVFGFGAPFFGAG